MCDIVLQSHPKNAKAIYRKKKCQEMLLQKSQSNDSENQCVSGYKLEDKAVLKKMGIKESPLYEVRIIPWDLNKYGFFATKDIQSGTILCVTF